LAPEVAENIKPNYRCDIEATQKRLAEEQKIDYIAGHIKKGEVIVSNNEIVSKDTERAINSYLTEKNKREKVKTEENWFYILLGQSVFIVICLILLLV
jgi:membrane-associated HD superfamily phosphohydrolase